MAIIKCPECGHQINEREVVCPVCGVEIAGHVARCNVCGEVYFTDEALCPNCHSASCTVLGIDEPVPPVSPVIQDVKYGESQTPAEPTDEPAPAVVHPASGPSEAATVKAAAVKAGTTVEAEAPTQSPESPTPQESRVEHLADLDSPDAEIPDDADSDEPEDSESDAHKTDSSLKRNIIPLVVSLIVTLTVAAISMYYYQETKIAKEQKDFERAIADNDTTMMSLFLSKYTDASKAHRDTINQRIASIRLNEKEFGESFAKRDKQALLKYLKEHPSTKERQKILLLVDTLDWDSTVRVDSRQAYQDYLTAHADGKFAEEAKDKLRDKVLEATPADRDKMVNLFHNFFISVNQNEESQLTSNLSSKLSRFMGTDNAPHSKVVSWMNGQHKEDVSNVIWRLNKDYKITKREVSGIVQYTVDFTAQRDIVLKSGKTNKEHFRITTEVTADGKISSMDMSTYTPTSSTKPATSGEKAAAPATASKPAASTPKPAASTTAPKPAASTQKPASQNQKPAASTSSQKPTSPQGSSVKKAQ